MSLEYDIIADENVDFEVVRKLRASGFRILSILEFQQGISDKEVLEIANKLKAVILTEDKDFGELAYRQKLMNNGIILIRISNLTRNEKIEIITNMIVNNFTALRHSFSVFTNQGLRIKKV